MTLLDHNFEDWQLADASRDDLIRLCHYLRLWAKESQCAEIDRAADEAHEEGYREGEEDERLRIQHDLRKISPALASTVIP